MSAFVKFVTHDWWIALPMFAMSIIGVALVIWRLMLNLNAGTNLNEFLPIFQSKLDKDGIEGALKFCRSRQDIIPKKLFAAGLEVSKQGLAASRRAMNNTIEWDILPELNTLLPSILAIAK
ncbi:MAG: MotA/TolQ/ExbB proton channel family protein, partial [Planctomycetia bacterium]|nr:MotA/TolQ/ExbB proton channel family protein [Planctomycetia bacterium]